MTDEEEQAMMRKEGRGGRNDEEEGGTRRKEGQGGKNDEDEKGKVAQGRIDDPRGLVVLLNG